MGIDEQETDVFFKSGRTTLTYLSHSKIPVVSVKNEGNRNHGEDVNETVHTWLCFLPRR